MRRRMKRGRKEEKEEELDLHSLPSIIPCLPAAVVQSKVPGPKSEALGHPARSIHNHGAIRLADMAAAAAAQRSQVPSPRFQVIKLSSWCREGGERGGSWCREGGERGGWAAQRSQVPSPRFQVISSVELPVPLIHACIELPVPLIHSRPFSVQHPGLGTSWW